MTIEVERGERVKEPIYRAITGKLMAIENCTHSGNLEWKERHEEALIALMNTAPSGGGIDTGVTLLVSQCGMEKLVFQCDFHHIDEIGGYDGWTEHTVIVRPSLFFGLSLRFTGRDRDHIKDYLHVIMTNWLNELV